MQEQPTITILVADDDPFITRAYKTGLERAGYGVVTAEDGERTIEVMISVRPNLVLLDLIMPKKDGFEVLQIVKADPSLVGIPVLVFTNLSQDSDRKTALEYGAVDFLTKANVSLNELLLRIERLLEDTATPEPEPAFMPEQPAETETETETEVESTESTVPEVPAEESKELDADTAEAAALVESIRKEVEAVAEFEKANITANMPVDGSSSNSNESAPESTVPDLPSSPETDEAESSQDTPKKSE